MWRAVESDAMNADVTRIMSTVLRQQGLNGGRSSAMLIENLVHILGAAIVGL